MELGTAFATRINSRSVYDRLSRGKNNVDVQALSSIMNGVKRVTEPRAELVKRSENS